MLNIDILFNEFKKKTQKQTNKNDGHDAHFNDDNFCSNKNTTERLTIYRHEQN